MKRSNSYPPALNPLVLGLFLVLGALSWGRVQEGLQTYPTMGETPVESVSTGAPAPVPQLFVPQETGETVQTDTANGYILSSDLPQSLFAPVLGDEPVKKQEAILSQAKAHGGTAPTILIYHTHTTEAYTQTEQNPYRQTSAYRTREQDKSVVAVGEALKRELEELYGFTVLHDTTDHEPPKLATAYERSEVTMAAYKEKYPSLEVFIDVHRDASSDTGDYVLYQGKPTARLMCVVGKGEKYEKKPDFDSNLALAEAFTHSLNAMADGLGRQVRIKPGRYNQHLSSHCLLIEVGHNANTLEQALNAVPAIAQAFYEALSQTLNHTPSQGIEPTAEAQTFEPLPLVPTGATD